jgi:hypothetical protein
MISLNDVRVNQVCNQLGLPDKVVDELFLIGVVLPYDLDSDPLDEIAGALLLRLINNSHAAFKDLANDLIPELVLDCEESHERSVRRRESEVKRKTPGQKTQGREGTILLTFAKGTPSPETLKIKST